MTVTVFLVVAVVVLYLYSSLITRAGLAHMEYTRRFSKPAYYAGESAEMIETVRNRRAMVIPWLRVESRLPSSLRFGKQENLNITGDMYHHSVFFLMPHQQIRRRHRVTMVHRGVWNVGNATLTVGDLVGLGSSDRELRYDLPLVVYPRLLNEDEMPEAFSRLLGDMLRRNSLLTDPFLLSGIRPYRAGDNVRDIHWAATARTGETQVRLHDPTAELRLMVVVNSQMREDQWGDLMDYEQDTIEQEISMAATICISALRHGLSAGFAANMPQDKEKRISTVVMPLQGREREEELLMQFARLKVLRTHSFPSFMEEMQTLRGMDFLIISPYDSDTIQRGMRHLQAAGNTVRLYVMPKGEVHTA